MKKISLLALSFFLLSATVSIAKADMRFSLVSDPVAKKECSACHMAFQPAMLPSRSWGKMMDTLENHFGEDASLKDETTDHIKTYYMDNSADSGWFANKFLRGVDENAAPQRITELPYWVREHNHEVTPARWNDPKVKTKANCQSCHPRADQGNYDDD